MIPYTLEDEDAGKETVSFASSTRISEALPTTQLETFTEVAKRFEELSADRKLVSDILNDAAKLHKKWFSSVAELQARCNSIEDLIQIAFQFQEKNEGIFLKQSDIIHGDV